MLSILEEAARWLACRGIEGWQPGSFSRRRIADWIERGKMYLAATGATPPRVPVTFTAWRSSVNSAVGGWAGERAALSGESYLRLDCGAENRGLNEYYERADFCCRGRVRVWGFGANLHEKRVDVVGAG